MLLFNPSDEPLDFTIPESVETKEWQVVVDTDHDSGFVEGGKLYKRDQPVLVAARSLTILNCPHCFSLAGFNQSANPS